MITSIALEKCKKECDIVYVTCFFCILVQGFCPLKIKITHFPEEFCLQRFLGD